MRHAGGTVFIRRVHTRTRASSEPYSSCRLVRSVRSGNSVRQVTLLNLGAIPRHPWNAGPPSAI